MAAEKWFCLVDVKYYEEDTYVPRHNKMIIREDSLHNVLNFVENHIGDQIDSISLTWAGKLKQECKQELVFTESEFAAFDTVKDIIENDHSYKDYCEMREKHERSKKNQ